MLVRRRLLIVWRRRNDRIVCPVTHPIVACGKTNHKTERHERR